jgi:hypothetical protein
LPADRPPTTDLTGRQNALRSVPMGDQGIALGTMLFTMVEPARGHEVEYNRWYERDHFYAGCMVGENTFAGDRFVATKRLKDLRYPAESPMTPDLQTGSYLALYWVLAGHHDEWNRWSVDNVVWLHQNGRMFAERTHIHTVLYQYGWSVQSGDRSTSAELALDRGYAGLVVNVGELTDGHSAADIEEWTRTSWAPGAMAQAWGPDLVLNATPLPLLDDAPADVPRIANADRRFLQLHFLDHDPAEEWAGGYGRFGAELEASGVATHLWSAPFIQTVFGTDAYTGELW